MTNKKILKIINKGRSYFNRNDDFEKFTLPGRYLFWDIEIGWTILKFIIGDQILVDYSYDKKISSIEIDYLKRRKKQNDKMRISKRYALISKKNFIISVLNGLEEYKNCKFHISAVEILSILWKNIKALFKKDLITYCDGAC